MVSTKVNNSRVLIVAGYTDDEQILRSDKKSKKKVGRPPSFLFEARNIQYTPRHPAYDEFRSAQGLSLQEKACDEYEKVTMEILVHQNLSNTKGKVVIDKTNRQIRIRVTDNSIPKDNNKEDELLLGRYVRPEEFTDKYIEVRSDFFEDLKGRPLTIVSPLFKSMTAAFLQDYDYTIGEGEEEAAYSVSFQGVEPTYAISI